MNYNMFRSARILILLLLGSGTNVFSQQLSRQVLVPVAGVISTRSINFSQTIGETAVEIFTGPDFILTQGFQQPGIKLSKENPPPGNGVNVYPNPVTDVIYVELFGDVTRSFRIDIINVSGTLVRTEKMGFAYPFWQILPFSVDRFGKGIYFIRIISEDGLISRTFKIEKI
jgi:hypothetical protein